MNSSQTSETNRNTYAVLRRVGISLTVIGAFIFAVGLLSYVQNTGECSLLRCVLVLIFSLLVFVSGLCIWRSSNKML